MSNYTKGKWKASSYEGGWDCVRDEENQIICQLSLNTVENALLIAAAPELLEACKMMKKLDNDDIGHTNESSADCPLCHAFLAIDKAIAQAEGNNG